MATYVITEACIGVKDATCVEVCPASCIHTTPDAPQFYIDPEACIVCEQCFLVCPVSAIYLDSEVPESLREYIDVNKVFFEQRVRRNSISSEQAQHILEAIMQYATREGLPVSIAVVDASGAVIVAGHREGASEETANSAADKAYTAVSLLAATHQLSRGGGAPTTVVPPEFDRGRLVSVGGGLCIWDRDMVVGGIGVAGSPGVQQDVACAQVGVEVLRHGSLSSANVSG